MSSSFLDGRRTSYLRRGRIVVPALCVIAGGGSAAAAEFFIQPEVGLQSDISTNRGLITQSDRRFTGEGYNAQLGATLGYDTPVSDSLFRGTVGYGQYPQDREHELQGTAELATEYRWQTSTFSVAGRFDRLNTLSSELANPLYDPVVPSNPTTPETGRVSADTARTMANLFPRFVHRFTERLSAGASAVVEETVYSGRFARNYSSYTYGQGTVFADYAWSPRLDVSVGPYVSRNLAREGEASVTGTGGNLGFKYKVGPRFIAKLDISGESDQNTLDSPTGSGTTQVRSSAYGAMFTATWLAQISQFNASIGRQLTPSGSGGEYFADQFWVEYQRSLNPRLQMTSAVRAIRYTPAVDEQAQSPYKYVDATIALKWLITRTWHISGGVEYVRVDYGSAINTGTSVAADQSALANNFRVFIGFGYLALGPKSALNYPY